MLTSYFRAMVCYRTDLTSDTAGTLMEKNFSATFLFNAWYKSKTFRSNYSHYCYLCIIRLIKALVVHYSLNLHLILQRLGKVRLSESDSFYKLTCFEEDRRKKDTLAKYLTEDPRFILPKAPFLFHF